MRSCKLVILWGRASDWVIACSHAHAPLPHPVFETIRMHQCCGNLHGFFIAKQDLMGEVPKRQSCYFWNNSKHVVATLTPPGWIPRTPVWNTPSTTMTAKKSQPTEDQRDTSSQIKGRDLILLILVVLAIRLLNIQLIRSYFDPDEFWQTLEPAYCAAYFPQQSCAGLTWEWKRRGPPDSGLIEGSLWGPARSYLSVVPTYWYYRVLQWLQLDSTIAVSRGPMYVATLLQAVPTDIAVWYTAHHLPRRNADTPFWVLMFSLTSWFNAYSSVRTFANGQETMALAVAVALSCPELFSQKRWNGKISWRFYLAFFLGGLSAAVRFSAVAAFVPLGIILALKRDSVLDKLSFLFNPCAFFGVAGLTAAAVVDRIFYGFWTIPALGNLHFNAVLDNAKLYGAHPFLWYFTSGVPAILGPLVLFLFFSASKSKSQVLPLWTIWLVFVVVMSFNDHKEFRYIHPILPLVCLICGSSMPLFREGLGRVRNSLLIVGLSLASLIAVVFLGLWHQSGPILANQAITAACVQESRTGSVSVHYLNGDCHMTPLLSYLHIPGVEFATWSLDCSPECRKSPDLECENHRFQRDPSEFVKHAYEGHKVPPDFVVTYSSYLGDVSNSLQAFTSCRVVGNYPHHLVGASIFRSGFGDVNSSIYRSIDMSGLDGSFFVEDVVLLHCSTREGSTL